MTLCGIGAYIAMFIFTGTLRTAWFFRFPQAFREIARNTSWGLSARLLINSVRSRFLRETSSSAKVNRR